LVKKGKFDLALFKSLKKAKICKFGVDKAKLAILDQKCGD